MAELEADTVVILSSELISKIVGEYFNRKMFKENVEIVDLKSTETGYMFSVAFVKKEVALKYGTFTGGMAAIRESTEEEFSVSIDKVVKSVQARANNGKFAKVKE